MNLWFLFNMTLLTKVVELFYFIIFSNKLAEDIFCAGILKFGLHFNLPSCSSSVLPYQLVFYTFNAIISRKGMWLPNSMLQNHPDPIGLKGNIYFLIERIHWLGLWHLFFISYGNKDLTFNLTSCRNCKILLVLYLALLYTPLLSASSCQ